MDNQTIFKPLIASATGSLVAELITLPICTLKTVYQNNINLTINETINKIKIESGYRGFYQAAFPAILSQVASTSIKFTFYELIKDKRKTDKKDIMNNSINGALGGIIGSIFTHPIDVWKNYEQRNESYINQFKKYLKKKNSGLMIKELIYAGYLGSFGKNIALYSSLYPLYDLYSGLLEDTKYKIISPILTSLTVSLIIQPFDYYKTVKMAGGLTSKYTRGLSLMITRSIPHFWITMYITELLKK